MSVKWTGIHSESGILRKSEFKEKKEELFVFGYSCKLFRDDDKALHIDQGKHLIPWMGDESLKIDRYDARGALHELVSLEAPPGGYDWRVELTRSERDVELLCDEERYRALHTDEDEEEMYKEEELKRLHAAGYGQVGFNYEAGAPPPEPPPQETDEPFVPTEAFKSLFPPDTIFPEREKQNAIIEKTAKFIASQGAQLEILIKAKQGDSPQFHFLSKESTLNAYYAALVGLIKTDKWPEKPPLPVQEKCPEPAEEYLHPSLASTIVESAPSIPSIAYRPSADCDYTLLVSRLRGSPPPPPRGTPPPPGTAPLPLPAARPLGPHAPPPAHIERGPVLFAHAETRQRARQEQAAAPARPAPPVLAAAASTGLSLMKHYNSDTDSDPEQSNESKETAMEAEPPAEVRVVIDKMAAYVARNGDEFADIVRAKRDPRFAFLQPRHPHHAYYARAMRQRRAAAPHRSNAVVSFCIKKHKEPDPILPKPALPYESSSDDEAEEADKREPPRADMPEVVTVNHMPPVLVYKLEGTYDHILPIVKSFEPLPVVKQAPPATQPVAAPAAPQAATEPPKLIDTPVVVQENQTKVIPPKIDKVEENIEKYEASSRKADTVDKNKRRESPDRGGRERRRRDRKRAYRSKSESKESRRAERRSEERERREKDYDRYKRKRKASKEEMDSEIISLVDNSDDLIDLTGDQSDSRGAAATEAAPRRADELWRRAGLRAPAALPATSLASAMADTLETLRKKKAEEEEKRRRRERRTRRGRREHEQESGRHRRSKRRHRHRSSDEERSDCDGSKRKKRKKDKKQSSKDKKRKRESDAEDDLPIAIDLTSTLRELRTSSPTRDLGLDKGVEEDRPCAPRDTTSEEETEEGEVAGSGAGRGRREYSEGEWSSDSGAESGTPDASLLRRT